MTRDRKLLIVVGLILIALLIAIASFSLGVYVGTHGLTAGPPSLTGPVQPAGQPPAPGQPEPDQPTPLPLTPAPTPERVDPFQSGVRPLMTGRVRSVSRNTVTLDTQQGPRLFELDAEALISRWDGRTEQPATLAEVAPGEHLAVFGRFEGDGGRRLVAERLLLLPPPVDQPGQP